MSIRAKGKTTVPQIFINNQSVGGCDELYALEESNQLDNLINQNK
ncbi:Glutaredoxin 3 (Grx1) [Prochlorococcus marinus str. SS2]|nr:Glutaredoxin 3 (Grx1) [Prochlorococcus marinus str. LG]KGG18565.1 Glutaredoxin 3 (Grx1) [Prochlorococcus marinus str. SS2]KGG22838.1 Glutaredoxin 3 (Grx1) [Prochlorococcus marinus str. SS35]